MPHSICHGPFAHRRVPPERERIRFAGWATPYRVTIKVLPDELVLNSRKMQFSAAYIRALAAVVGLTVAVPEPDCDSEDIVLSARSYHTRIRSPKVALQLKCSGRVTKDSAGFAYPLKIKNYDDLRPVNLAVPRLLVVLEVPRDDDPASWLDEGDDRLCLLHTAYWSSLYGYKAVPNRATVTIHIPGEQRLTLSSLNSIMTKLGNGERL